MYVHNCDDHPCTNPRHLSLVLRGENHPVHLHPEVTQGVRNSRAKLTEADVYTIRAEWDGTWQHTRRLAKRYGIAVPAMGKIVRRINWAHLPAQPGDVQPAAERAWARGERIKNALLTADIARQIRVEWDQVADKYRARAGFCRLASERYGTRPVAIDKILRGINWRQA